MKLSLLVIRCEDLELSKFFYEKLGFIFTEEKHGDGPRHYAAECDGYVFELYPARGEPTIDRSMLGFHIPNFERIKGQFDIKGIYPNAVNTKYIIIDPDLRKIEIS